MRVERHAMRRAGPRQQHRAVLDAGQPAGEMRLAVDRLARHDLRQPADEPPVVGFAAQRPIQPRRRHFEGVARAEPCRQFVLDVEQRAEVLADPLAVFDADRFRGRVARALGWRPGGRAVTRSTQPIDSRRNCRSKSSSPWLAATRGRPRASSSNRCLSMAVTHVVGEVDRAPGRPLKHKKWARAHYQSLSR